MEEPTIEEVLPSAAEPKTYDELRAWVKMLDDPKGAIEALVELRVNAEKEKTKALNEEMVEFSRLFPVYYVTVHVEKFRRCVEVDSPLPGMPNIELKFPATDEQKYNTYMEYINRLYAAKVHRGY